MSVPMSQVAGQVHQNQDGDIQAQIERWKHLSMEEFRLRLYCEMKSNEDHGRGQNVSAHHWSSQAKQHAHKSDEFNRICMQLILQQNNATAPNAASFNAGVSMQPPPSLSQGAGDQQAFQPQPTYPQHHHQHYVGSHQQQQLHAHHPQQQNGTQPFQTGTHQPQVNYQQPQPGYQQSQFTSQQPQAGYQQPQQQFQQSGGPGQQQNYNSQQEQNLPGLLFRLAKSCCTIM